MNYWRKKLYIKIGLGEQLRPKDMKQLDDVLSADRAFSRSFHYRLSAKMDYQCGQTGEA